MRTVPAGRRAGGAAASSGVPDVVRALRVEVRGVGLGDAIDSRSAVDNMDIHVEGYEYLPGVVVGRGQLKRKNGE
jgi:hypothetical protein